MQVTLKLNSPDPMLPYGLDQDGMAGDVVGPAGLAHPDSLGSTTNGAGPYMIDPKATILNSQYVYVKNPYYWDPSAQAWDKVVIKIISDGNSRMSALKTGQVQVAEGAATEAAEVEAAGLKIYSARRRCLECTSATSMARSCLRSKTSVSARRLTSRSTGRVSPIRFTASTASRRPSSCPRALAATSPGLRTSIRTIPRRPRRCSPKPASATASNSRWWSSPQYRAATS